MKWNTIQLRFPAIYSKTNPCPNSYGCLLNFLLSSNNDKWHKKKGGEEYEAGFSFGENQKQLLHEQFWLHFTQGEQSA